MKRVLKNDSGYSLLLAIGVVIIFTVLGLSLLTLTSSGIAKNSTREDTIQAQDLSDKGIDYVVKDIQTYLEDEIIDNPMGKTAFNTFLTNTLGKSTLSCPIDTDSEAIKASKGIKIPGENSNSTMVCIADVAEIKNTNGVVEEKDKYKRLVTFKSIGTVNGKEHVTTSKVIIGTDAVPDQLRYALSTNDEGNLFLHGGVEIQGDIKTDGNLIVSNYASYDTDRWTPSVNARLLKDSKSISSKIILSKNNKNIYFLTHSKNNSFDYDNHIKIFDKDLLKSNSNYTYKDASLIGTQQYNDFINSKFTYSDSVSVIKKETPIDSLDVTKDITDNYSRIGITKKDSLRLNSRNEFNNSIIKNATKDSIFFIGDYGSYCTDYGLFGHCKEYKTGFHDGDFTLDIGNKTSNQPNPINLNGTYYVYGNLTIDNSVINSDAIIYVNGNVKITNSILSSIDSTSTLIIFATGNIDITNISQYTTQASVLKAFFYSKKELLIYGVGSNIEIQGGISAKKLILSGVRGDSKSFGNYPNLSVQQGTIVDSYGKTVPALPSRLKIIYDQNLIDQYTTFKRDIEHEYITTINEPELIERTQ